MASVEATVEINGQAEAVFDLVTMARFWPRWHPATRAVGGVVERPYQLGDLVQERAEIGGMTAQVTWRVAEHERPRRVVLEETSLRATIAYDFEPIEEGVVFRRRLDYDDTPFRALPDPGAMHSVMQDQSEEALRRVKELVERILAAESEG